MRPIEVNKGDRYGRWTVIKEVEQAVRNNRRFKVKCDCGTLAVARLADMRHGKSVSCGCFKVEDTIKRLTTHGMNKRGKRHPLYTVWSDMKTRCYSKTFHAYHRYGGRGIRVCKEWRDDPGAFIEWALANGWEKGLELDRRNNDKNYSKSNCRFVPHIVNSWNRAGRYGNKVKLRKFEASQAR